MEGHAIKALIAYGNVAVRTPRGVVGYCRPSLVCTVQVLAPTLSIKRTVSRYPAMAADMRLFPP